MAGKVALQRLVRPAVDHAENMLRRRQAFANRHRRRVSRRRRIFGLCGKIISQGQARSEEHTSELQSLMRISYAVFCLKKKKSKEQIMTKVTIYIHSRHIESDTRAKLMI